MHVSEGRRFGRSTHGPNGSKVEFARSSAGQKVSSGEKCLLILDCRALDRECLAKALVDRDMRIDVSAAGSLEEWRKQQELHPPLGAILLNLGGRKVTEGHAADEIERLATEFPQVPVIILADIDDLAQILKALECGARGYIPASVGIEVCVEAIGLAMAGGIFVPASSLLAMRRRIDPRTQERSLAGVFTLRQAEVVQALRRGKANKIIAHELNLRESTVKVHIRNIMKKLKATNRTEVAYKINDLFPPDADFHTTVD